MIVYRLFAMGRQFKCHAPETSTSSTQSRFHVKLLSRFPERLAILISKPEANKSHTRTTGLREEHVWRLRNIKFLLLPHIRKWSTSRRRCPRPYMWICLHKYLKVTRELQCRQRS